MRYMWIQWFQHVWESARFALDQYSNSIPASSFLVPAEERGPRYWNDDLARAWVYFVGRALSGHCRWIGTTLARSSRVPAGLAHGEMLHLDNTKPGNPWPSCVIMHNHQL